MVLVSESSVSKSKEGPSASDRSEELSQGLNAVWWKKICVEPFLLCLALPADPETQVNMREIK